MLQAAGRVIRSETDRGAVLLIDERFPQKPYRSCPQWKPRIVNDSSELKLSSKSFRAG